MQMDVVDWASALHRLATGPQYRAGRATRWFGCLTGGLPSLQRWYVPRTLQAAGAAQQHGPHGRGQTSGHAVGTVLSNTMWLFSSKSYSASSLSALL